MKSIKTISMTATALLFVACGGGGGDNNDSVDTATVMQKHTPYTMQAGKTITRTEVNTIIELETDISTGKTTATLMEGGAKIE